MEAVCLNRMQWIRVKRGKQASASVFYSNKKIKKTAMSQSKPKVTPAYEESLKSVRYKRGVKACGVK